MINFKAHILKVLKSRTLKSIYRLNDKLRFDSTRFNKNEIMETTLEDGGRKGSSESNISIEEEVENGKNKHLVKCQFCPSRILNPGLGMYSEGKFDLPMMTRKKNNSENEDVQYETLTYFWQINDMYTFENICFSNTVNSIKYLACADCEIGPVGYYNMDTKISYVALARVNHVD